MPIFQMELHNEQAQTQHLQFDLEITEQLFYSLVGSMISKMLNPPLNVAALFFQICTGSSLTPLT